MKEDKANDIKSGVNPFDIESKKSAICKDTKFKIEVANAVFELMTEILKLKTKK